MAEIELTQGVRAVVDDADYALLSQWKWQAKRTEDGKFYARRMVKPPNRPGNISIMMHSVILGLPSGIPVDHADRDTLNNRRLNLRACNHSQNAANRGICKTNTSGLKGVRFDRGRWVAMIRVRGTLKNLGRFPEKLQAALAYDTAASQAFGEFAVTNTKLGILPIPQ